MSAPLARGVEAAAASTTLRALTPLPAGTVPLLVSLPDGSTVQVQVPLNATVDDVKAQLVAEGYGSEVDFGVSGEDVELSFANETLDGDAALLDTNIVEAYGHAGGLLRVIEDGNLDPEARATAVETTCAVVEQLSNGVRDMEVLCAAAMNSGGGRYRGKGPGSPGDEGDTVRRANSTGNLSRRASAQLHPLMGRRRTSDGAAAAVAGRTRDVAEGDVGDPAAGGGSAAGVGDHAVADEEEGGTGYGGVGVDAVDRDGARRGAAAGMGDADDVGEDLRTASSLDGGEFRMFDSLMNQSTTAAHDPQSAFAPNPASIYGEHPVVEENGILLGGADGSGAPTPSTLAHSLSRRLPELFTPAAVGILREEESELGVGSSAALPNGGDGRHVDDGGETSGNRANGAQGDDSADGHESGTSSPTQPTLSRGPSVVQPSIQAIRDARRSARAGRSVEDMPRVDPGSGDLKRGDTTRRLASIGQSTVGVVAEASAPQPAGSALELNAGDGRTEDVEGGQPVDPDRGLSGDGRASDAVGGAGANRAERPNRSAVLAASAGSTWLQDIMKTWEVGLVRESGVLETTEGGAELNEYLQRLEDEAVHDEEKERIEANEGPTTGGDPQGPQQEQPQMCEQQQQPSSQQGTAALDYEQQSSQQASRDSSLQRQGYGGSVQYPTSMHQRKFPEPDSHGATSGFGASVYPQSQHRHQEQHEQPENLSGVQQPGLIRRGSVAGSTSGQQERESARQSASQGRWQASLESANAPPAGPTQSQQRSQQHQVQPSHHQVGAQPIPGGYRHQVRGQHAQFSPQGGIGQQSQTASQGTHSQESGVGSSTTAGTGSQAPTVRAAARIAPAPNPQGSGGAGMNVTPAIGHGVGFGGLGQSGNTIVGGANGVGGILGAGLSQHQLLMGMGPMPPTMHAVPSKPAPKKRGRKRKNPELTEEERALVRKLQNRESAKLSRVRRKVIAAEYEEQISELVDNNKRLHEQVTALNSRLTFLQSLLTVHVQPKTGEVSNPAVGARGQAEQRNLPSGGIGHQESSDLSMRTQDASQLGSVCPGQGEHRGMGGDRQGPS